MQDKKGSFIEAYQKTFGNISQSCKAIDISRRAYYNWIRDDAEFKAELDAIEPVEVFIDFAENCLIKKMQDGDTTAIIYALKAKGKKRGWYEKHEVQHEGALGIMLIEGNTDPADEPIKD